MTYEQVSLRWNPLGNRAMRRLRSILADSWFYPYGQDDTLHRRYTLSIINVFSFKMAQPPCAHAPLLAFVARIHPLHLAYSSKRPLLFSLTPRPRGRCRLCGFTNCGENSLSHFDQLPARMYDIPIRSDASAISPSCDVLEQLHLARADRNLLAALHLKRAAE